MIFLFLRWDMLVPLRVSVLAITKTGQWLVTTRWSGRLDQKTSTSNDVLGNHMGWNEGPLTSVCKCRLCCSRTLLKPVCFSFVFRLQHAYVILSKPWKSHQVLLTWRLIFRQIHDEKAEKDRKDRGGDATEFTSTSCKEGIKKELYPKCPPSIFRIFVGNV